MSVIQHATNGVVRHLASQPCRVKAFGLEPAPNACRDPMSAFFSTQLARVEVHVRRGEELVVQQHAIVEARRAARVAFDRAQKTPDLLVDSLQLMQGYQQRLADELARGIDQEQA